MVAEVLGDYPTESAALKAVAQKLGIGSTETLRNLGAAGPDRLRDPSGDEYGGISSAEGVEEGESRAAAGERDLEGGGVIPRGRDRPATSTLVAFIDEAPGPLRRCRSDLPRTHRARLQDRPLHVLRPPRAAWGPVRAFRGRGVSVGRFSVVPSRWRHGVDLSGRAHRPLPELRGARGDRDSSPDGHGRRCPTSSSPPSSTSTDTTTDDSTVR